MNINTAATSCLQSPLLNLGNQCELRDRGEEKEKRKRGNIVLHFSQNVFQRDIIIIFYYYRLESTKG